MRKLLFFFACAAVGGCSPSGPRDVAGENKDVRVDTSQQPDGGAPASNDTYAYVARRPHGVVALAEARNMSDDDAHALVDRLASDFEACATKLESEHALVEGAARIVAIAQPSGPPGLNVRVAPGGDVAQNALLCLVAPVRALMFPKSTGRGAPGMAIEATWGPRAAGAVVDGGGPL